VSILLYEIFYFYIQIRSVYNRFNVHQCALVHPTEFAIIGCFPTTYIGNTV